MSENSMLPLCIIMVCLSFALVLIDWYSMHKRYAFSHVPNLVNRVFVFFCLAMLGSNAIILAKAEYGISLYFSLVVTLTETLFLCTSRVKT